MQGAPLAQWLSDGLLIAVSDSSPEHIWLNSALFRHFKPALSGSERK